jgi:hypothetical protein
LFAFLPEIFLRHCMLYLVLNFSSPLKLYPYMLTSIRREK